MSQMEALMKEINKEFKGDILHKGLAVYDYQRIPFTSPRLNYMTYGGIPMGKLIEFYGEEHGGKTTTALDIVANYQNMEDSKGVVYADLENTLDSVWATKLGVDFTRDNIWVMNPTNQGAETIFEKILQMIATDEIGLVVIDSIGVMVSNQALEKSVEDKTYGGIAMALTNFSKKAEMLCHKHKCTIIGINQMRDDMNSMYGGVTTTGGKALKFYSSIRMPYCSQNSLSSVNSKSALSPAMMSSKEPFKSDKLTSTSITGSTSAMIFPSLTMHMRKLPLFTQKPTTSMIKSELNRKFV